jgi:uncharacterized repeat protein (TIGR03803 family)
VLYRFKGGTDGDAPQGGVVLDGKGNLYGTTRGGGGSGFGTVWTLAADGTESAVHAFGADGWYPNSDLARDAEGNLYGTTAAGGDFSCDNYAGCGLVFKITP